MTAATLSLLFCGFTLLCFLLVNSASRQLHSYWTNLTEAVEPHLRQTRFAPNAGKTVAILMVCVVMLIILLAATGAGSITVFICTLAAVVSPVLLCRYLEKCRIQRIKSALPDSLSQISAAMRSGSTFHMALQAQVDNGVGDLEREFAIVLREQRVGVRIEDAMDNLAERINSEEVDLMVSAVSIAQDIGGNLAETLQSLSDTIRQKMDMEGKINSLTAQGRLQGYIVSALPFLMLMGFAFFEPDSTMPIFTSLLGWIVLGLIVTMQLIGGVMIRKLVSIDI